MVSVFQILLHCFLGFLLIAPLQAQVSDSFSDGNLTENPAWQGDLANFKVNTALQLQLNAPAAGVSKLFLPTQIADSNIWELYLRLEFDPSNSNTLRVYLQADQSDLLSANGYYLSLGKDGNTDAIEFFRQDAGVGVLLASATHSAIAFSPSPRIKVTKKSDGLWTLNADYSGGTNYSQEFTVQDNTYQSGEHFFGIHCTYTVSRRDKFFFDDILVSPLIPDTTAPALIKVNAISATELEATFNEPLDELPASEPSNYFVNNGIGEPLAAFLDLADKKKVSLLLDKPLASQVNYILTVKDIKDQAGNSVAMQTAGFTFISIEPAREFDLLINEIMADPSPPVGLPNVEFIELYNRSNKVIDLASLNFSSGGTPQPFSSFLFFPGTYVLVCDDSNIDSLKNFGSVVPLVTFPTLTNDADDLTLANLTGEVIHAVSYKSSWYKDSFKAEGGWSLELINPFAPCEEENNWRASANLTGGTPGQPNSVLKAEPDTKKPSLTRVVANRIRPIEIQLFFDEGLDGLAAENKDSYSVDNGIGITAATLILPAKNKVILELSSPLQPNIEYVVNVSQNVLDCSGNPIGDLNSLSFALPDTIGPMDIVINEILFNPEVGGADFVELYNRSDKILNLGDLIIGNLQKGVDTVVAKISSDRLLFPEQFAVFTEMPTDILSRYTVFSPDDLIDNDLPSFNDDEGNVTIYRIGGSGTVIIDAFDYHKDFHHPLLDDRNGVSLERLRYEAPTQDRVNWHSASALAGFGTPTYKNSQHFENQFIQDDIFEIPEQKLSPDGDGFQDYLVINYKVDKPGYTAKIKIFDSEGRLVKSLLNNELIASEGFFRWDGDTDDGAKARIGIYVIWFQLFHPDGSVREFKKTCVVAGRL